MTGGQQAVLQQVTSQAWGLYANREWDKAEQACRLILRTVPEYFDALHLLGIIAAQSGRAGEASSILERASTLNRGDPTVHNNYANVLRDLKRFDAALVAYAAATELNPLYAEAHYNLGVTLQEMGRLPEALASYDRAIAVNPQYASAHNNRGVTLRELKRFDEALDSFGQALAVRSDYHVAFNNRGITEHELKQFDKALESYSQALKSQPRYADALSNRGHALKELSRNEEALAAYDAALALSEGHADALNGRGSVLQLLKRPQDALQSYERACAAKPDYAIAHFNCGNVLWELQHLEGAVACYERSLSIDPANINTLQNLGIALMELKRYVQAREVLTRALQIRPEHPWLFGMWLHVKMRTCDWTGLQAHIDDLAARIRRGERATAPFTVIGIKDSLELQRKAAHVWLAHMAPDIRTPLPEVLPRGARIRLGYFSADFCDHATASLAAGLFEAHDRSRFEVIGFDFGPRLQDDMTQRLSAAFDRLVDVRDLTDAAVAQLARQMQVDIAIDLKGHTKQQRIGIFAHRAAPVQISYLGYPGTLDAPYIDYLVADHTVIPEHSQPQYAEKIIYLPDSYQVNDRRRAVAEVTPCRAELGLPAQGFVFCCFNSPYKLLPDTFASWMRILAQTDGSVLWLLEEDPAASVNLRRAASAAGITPARLVFAGPLPMQQHLARYRRADLFLDTWPCNAHTTASDALWVDLPVLTCPGESFTARVAASLLAAVGLPELITHGPREYEELAIQLASDRQRLAALKLRLQANRLTAPLFNTQLYTKHLEAAYTAVYERLHGGLAPEHLSVL